MIGQLGTVNVAGVGFAGKFSSVFSVLVAAIGTVAGIMISQYMGQKNRREIRRSFYLNLILATIMALGFTVVCIMFPKQIMGLYTERCFNAYCVCRLSKNCCGNFLANCRSDTAFYDVSLYGKISIAFICKHNIGNYKYRIELHFDLWEIGNHCDGCKWRGCCHPVFPRR